MCRWADASATNQSKRYTQRKRDTRKIHTNESDGTVIRAEQTVPIECSTLHGLTTAERLGYASTLGRSLFVGRLQSVDIPSTYICSMYFRSSSFGVVVFVRRQQLVGWYPLWMSVCVCVCIGHASRRRMCVHTAEAASGCGENTRLYRTHTIHTNRIFLSVCWETHWGRARFCRSVATL